MGLLLVAVFKDNAGARAGAAILRSLHDEGALTLYALAIVARRTRGTGLTLREPVGAADGAAAPAVSAAVGALACLLGGPLTVATRSLASGLVTAVRDLDKAGLDPGFLEQITGSLRPCGQAVIAEIEEYRPLPLDARVVAAGGRVFRHLLAGALAEERIVRQVKALRGEVARLRIEPNDTLRTPVGKAVQRARALELSRTLRQLAALAAALRHEGAAKATVLRAQAALLEGAARLAVEDRAKAVLVYLEARASWLDRVRDAAEPPPSLPRGGVRGRRHTG